MWKVLSLKHRHNHRREQSRRNLSAPREIWPRQVCQCVRVCVLDVSMGKQTCTTVSMQIYTQRSYTNTRFKDGWQHVSTQGVHMCRARKGVLKNVVQTNLYTQRTIRPKTKQARFQHFTTINCQKAFAERCQMLSACPKDLWSWLICNAPNARCTICHLQLLWFASIWGFDHRRRESQGLGLRITVCGVP